MIVVFGPRTRLARAFLALPAVRARGVALVARDPVEARELGATWADAAVVPGWKTDGAYPQSATEVAVVFCALGVIHPDRPNLPEDRRKAERDLEALRRAVMAYRRVPLHGIFVSSVVALSPPRRRAYYGGWKGLTEGSIAAVLKGHPQPRFSVVYPGRLIDEKPRRWTGPLFATPYERVARRIATVIERREPQSLIVGVDARLWLLARTFEHGITAAFGRVPTVELDLRDGPPASTTGRGE